MRKFYSLLLVLLFGISTYVQAVNYCATSSWGYCGTNVTGGGNATPTLVTNESQLATALGKGNVVIIITQDITVTNHISSSKSNMTIMALPGKKLISTQQNSSNSGILYLKGNNLILRNLTFVGPGAYDCDGWDNLCFDKATNCWVDHCDFQDGCDGNFDNKGTTDNITISWCRFRYLKEPRAGGSGGADDHRFTNLVGSSSSDKPSDGTYNITWAFCWWDEGCKERMTRCRNCEQHFLNCYWNSSVANYYVGPENAKCYFEGCTFEGKANSSSKIWKSYGGTNSCKFVNCSGNLPSNSGSVSAPSYSYDQMSASAAKSMVTNSSCGAGATLVVTTAGRVYSSCDGGATPTLYTVTWNATANGGTCATATTQVASGDAIGTLPTATKSGYTFNGWYTAASGGTKISANTVITGNVTYYAQFTENQGGGDPVTPEGDITWNFSRDEFNGLGTITATTTIQGLTMVATSDASMTVDANTKTIGDLTFTHRLKTGGTGKAESRSLNFAVTGQCTIELYLVSGGSADRTVNVYSGSYGGTLLTTLAAPQTTPVKQTYEYTGGATTIHMGSANSGINFYGINLIYPGGDDPTPTTYTLTYDENGGSGTMAEQTVNSGGSVTIAANGFTAPAGYTFKEWNSHPNGSGTKYTVGQSVTLTANLTIYAVWQPNTYTVTLNAAGGTGGTTSVTVTYDAAMPNITIPTRDGYTFLGYYSQQNGAGTQYYDANGSSTNSWTTAGGGTLYAAWEEASVTPIVDGDLHFWFFYADDATANGLSNDNTVFSQMVASGSQMAGSITIDGHSYSVTRRTGDNQVFGQFTIPTGKEAIFYALAVSSGGGDRQINLVNGNTKIELPVAGGSDSYKRLESETLAAGTYSIEREGSSNVRLAVVVLCIVDAGTTPQPTYYTVTWNANGGTCATATSTIEENTPVGTLPEPTREGYTFDGWWTAADGGTAVTSATVITADITFFAHWTENQGGDPTESVIFHWRWAGDGTSPANGSTLTTISGTMTLQTSDASKSASTESAAYAASVPADLKSLGSKGVKLGANALYFVIEPISTAEGFKRGDTLYICGYNPVKISSTSEHSGDITDSIQTGTSKADYQSNYLTLNKNASALYLMRARGTGTGFTGIKVVRPANAPTYYTVTFKDNFGNTLKTEEVLSGSAATAPAIPAIECYTAGTWDVPFNNVTSDLVVTVTYTVNTHSVTLQYDNTQGTARFNN